MIIKSYLLEQNFDVAKHNFILFYGDNLGLQHDFKNKIKKINNKSQVIRFSQDDIIHNEITFLNEIFNISLFEKKKIYFIDQVNDKILNILTSIESKIDDQRFFLFAKNLEKKSKLRTYFEKSKDYGVIACYQDTVITIKKIIQNKLKEFKGLSNQSTNIIFESCGCDRFKLINEISKIETFFKDKIIDNKKLEILLNTKENEDFDILKDEALSGNNFKTNELLNITVMDSDKNVLYLNIINQRLNRLSEAYALANETSLNNVVENMRPPIFWKDKPVFLNQMNKLNSNKIRKIQKKTYNLEIELKSNSTINKQLLIKKLLVDICQLANS
jgi:DNA polymerase III subunit delta